MGILSSGGADVRSWVLMGRILGPFGIQGWVKIESYAVDAAVFGRIKSAYVGVGEPSESWRAVEIDLSKSHGDAVVAKLAGLSDRDAALHLKGLGIAVPRAKLPEIAENEVYLADLLGFEVINLAGTGLGQVVSVESNGAHEVIRVDDGERQRLLPFVPAYVEAVDKMRRVLRVQWGSEW